MTFGMSAENHFEIGIMGMRLKDTISLWQRFPDSPRIAGEMNKILKEASEHTLELKVRKETLRSGGKFNRGNIVPDYGRIDGEAVVFEIPPKDMKVRGMAKISLRMGSIKGENFLMLDSSVEQTFGFLKPEDIISLNIE